MQIGKHRLTMCSVIFASVYRFTVLFSYSASDPTYTLAPVVGWTAIEMSAGIISACLPTMRPAIHLIARKMGLKVSITGLIRGNEKSTSSRTGHSINNGQVAMDPPVRLEHSKNASQGAGMFYRLPDNGSGGSETLPIPMQAKLRPEHGYVYTVSSVPGNRDSTGSGNEIPLGCIGVQKDFKQTTS
jgi:hypothetical protein